MSDHDEAAFLPPRVKDPNTLPEPIRGFYATGDDGWARPRFGDFDEDDGYRFEDVRGLKSTLAKERSEAKEAVRELAELRARMDAYGDLDPEEAKDAIDKIRNGKVTGKDQIDAKLKATREQLAAKHEAEMKALREKFEKLNESVRRDKIDTEAAVIAAKIGLPEKLVKPYLKEVGMVIEDEEGRPVAAIRDENGEPRISMRSGSTARMTPLEWAEDILAKDPEIADLIPQKARGGQGGDRIAAIRRNGGQRGFDPKMSDEARLMEAYKLKSLNG